MAELRFGNEVGVGHPDRVGEEPALFQRCSGLVPVAVARVERLGDWAVELRLHPFDRDQTGDERALGCIHGVGGVLDDVPLAACRLVQPDRGSNADPGDGGVERVGALELVEAILLQLVAGEDLVRLRALPDFKVLSRLVEPRHRLDAEAEALVQQPGELGLDDMVQVGRV